MCIFPSLLWNTFFWPLYIMIKTLKNMVFIVTKSDGTYGWLGVLWRHWVASLNMFIYAFSSLNCYLRRQRWILQIQVNALVRLQFQHLHFLLDCGKNRHLLFFYSFLTMNVCCNSNSYSHSSTNGILRTPKGPSWG